MEKLLKYLSLDLLFYWQLIFVTKLGIISSIRYHFKELSLTVLHKNDNKQPNFKTSSFRDSCESSFNSFNLDNFDWSICFWRWLLRLDVGRPDWRMCLGVVVLRLHSTHNELERNIAKDVFRVYSLGFCGRSFSQVLQNRCEGVCCSEDIQCQRSGIYKSQTYSVVPPPPVVLLFTVLL